ncbi:HTTM domain-containing protein [Sorangium sp. So ce406]|uniref:HTTM domain-containing protein n=1 Tax=Sorangium sp. So ce406 TaxID=3133311 RepID=UPI003F5BB577
MAAPRAANERGLARAWAAVERFAFAPASAAPLAALRIGIASVLLVQAGMVAPALFELYGRSGILQGPLLDALGRPGPVRLSWLIDRLAPLGIGEAPVLVAVGALYVLALVALLVGWHTRLAAAGAWLSHLMLMMTADSTNYGVDQFANIFLFYLMWMPAGAALSLDRRLGRAPAGPTSAARLSLRVVQIHLCVVYLMSGLGKALGEQWWNGDAIWRTLNMPDYRQYDFTWLAHTPWLAVGAGWTVLLIECGYPLMIWPRRTRRIWVAATVALHAGIAVFMGLVVFGAIMAVLTLAAFAVRADPPGAVRAEADALRGKDAKPAPRHSHGLPAGVLRARPRDRHAYGKTCRAGKVCQR